MPDLERARNRVEIVLLAGLVLAVVGAPEGRAGGTQIVRPFEAGGAAGPGTAIDAPVRAALLERGIEPAPPCSDTVFVRRVYLDILGTLPEPAQVRAFLRDRSPGKRAALIDALLEREEFAEYRALKWCDLLRVKAEYPINLWPNAVQAYYRWILDAIRNNVPYDDFARALLTSSGSNFRVPPVNFYRGIQGKDPSSIAAAVALTFLGVRLEGWPEGRRAGLEAFFSRVAYKKTAEWKEEIVYLDPSPTGALEAVLPDGTTVSIHPGTDPRRVFADWLITPENRWFARNIANRVWSWYFGRGIIHEPDDIRPDNPPANPELLALLERELVAADWDLRALDRLILNSRTYQQSSIPRSDRPDAESLFAYYPVHPLEAEVLIDALGRIFGAGERYASRIPEPFTFLPENQRSIALADGSITSPFLEMFGRPPRDTGLESERGEKPTDAQRLHLLNSSHIERKIEASRRLRRLMRAARGNRRALVRGLYWNILSREPTRGELSVALGYFRTEGLTGRQAVIDLAWALINTKEFLYRH